MTFDDQLKRAFDTLSDRLRAEIDRQTASVVEELAETARAEREKATSEAREAAARVANGALEAAVADAREQAQAAGLSAGRAEGRQEGVRQGLEEGRRQGLEEGRLGVEEGRRQGFAEGRQQGLLEGRQEGVLNGREQAQAESREAVAAAVAAAQAQHAAAPQRTGSDELAASVDGIGRAKSLSEILDSLMSSAARQSAEAEVWVVRGDTLRKWRADDPGADLPLSDSGSIGDAVRTGHVATSGNQVAAPVALAGQVVAVVAARSSEAGAVDAGAISVLAQFSARSLEALTAVKTARAMSAHDGATGGARHDAAMAEEDESARRYARLLVSEIKLYHESAVVEGRRDRDLAARLGGEIARARVLYEERVPLQARHRADYFHEELVRTLANGDATLLQLK
jgi:hypothetical protein